MRPHPPRKLKGQSSQLNAEILKLEPLRLKADKNPSVKMAPPGQPEAIPNPRGVLYLMAAGWRHHSLTLMGHEVGGNKQASPLTSLRCGYGFESHVVHLKRPQDLCCTSVPQAPLRAKGEGGLLLYRLASQGSTKAYQP